MCIGRGALHADNNSSYKKFEIQLFTATQWFSMPAKYVSNSDGDDDDESDGDSDDDDDDDSTKQRPISWDH